jgi:D-lactate dehydrogenase
MRLSLFGPVHILMFVENTYMKVFIYSTQPYDEAALKKFSGAHQLSFTNKQLTLETVALASGDDVIAIFTSDDASTIVIEKLHSIGVHYIVLRSAGYDHVDIVKAAELGMEVANVPAYSPYSVAEHAVAMLLAMNRKIIEGQQLMQLQDFRLNTLVGFDLHDKVVGIVGTGKIGMAFASIMNGFGAKVIAYDPVENPQAIALGVKYLSFSQLLIESDIISVHCPLTDKTKHLFSKDEFLKMKKDCVLINTARGAIVHTADLIDAINDQQIGAACLDVYEYERGLYFNDHRNDLLTDLHYIKLKHLKNVLLTGHQGFLTAEGIQGIASGVIKNIDQWEANLPCENSLTSRLKQKILH